MQAPLKIEGVVVASGKEAERGALITAHYRGWLADGSEFDSPTPPTCPFNVY